jgi:hypothetical protein
LPAAIDAVSIDRKTIIFGIERIAAYLTRSFWANSVLAGVAFVRFLRLTSTPMSLPPRTGAAGRHCGSPQADGRAGVFARRRHFGENRW